MPDAPAINNNIEVRHELGAHVRSRTTSSNWNAATRGDHRSRKADYHSRLPDSRNIYLTQASMYRSSTWLHTSASWNCLCATHIQSVLHTTGYMFWEWGYNIRVFFYPASINRFSNLLGEATWCRPVYKIWVKRSMLGNQATTGKEASDKNQLKIWSVSAKWYTHNTRIKKPGTWRDDKTLVTVMNKTKWCLEQKLKHV